MSGLTFDPTGHRYAIDGRPVLSVTQILTEAGVIDYSSIPEATRQAAMARGRAVHLATQFDDEGDLDEAALADEYRPYLEAWRKFRRDFTFQPERIEYRGYNGKWDFAGTLDRSGLYRGKVKAIIDIKTGEPEAWVELQTAAYASFFDGPMEYLRLCVELKPSGLYRLFPFPASSYLGHFSSFCSLLAGLSVRNAYAHRALRTK